MANLQKIYSDIDFTFTKKPVTNDVALSYDAQAVIRSIRNLLSIRHYERLWNPDLGSNIQTALFEPINTQTSSLIETEIKELINFYEPRAKLSNVKVEAIPDKNAYKASISFYMENATTPTTVTLLLERNR
jgi:phage baseplate assembly protein W